MSEIKDYITQEQEKGSIFISQDVIATIAAVAASEVEGVYSLTGAQSGEFSDRFGKKSVCKGIRLSQNEEEGVYVECSLVANYGYNILELAKSVQENICASIESITGLKVASVDVNISGISMKK